MKRLSRTDRVFLFIDHGLLILLLVITLYPLLYVVMASVAAGPQNMTPYLIPKRISWVGYETVIQYPDIWTGYMNSLIYVVAGTLVNLAVTMCCAYPLSVPEFKFGKIVMTLAMITMYFGGGMIPTYLLIRDLGMLNTRWSLILPGAMSVHNMIVTRTYIKSSIPSEIRESAQMDGCGNIRYLFSMVLPLSKPILAVIALFCAVGIWNSYFSAMIYVTSKRNLYPVALILREILITGNYQMDFIEDFEYIMKLEERKEVMKYALIVITSLPVMIIYPFVQKFFVKGIMIGSVKG